MDVDLFDFELPKELIAQHPAEPRGSARLLHVAPSALGDRMVTDLPVLLRAGDMLVFNDTRVIPARLMGKKGEGGIEVTLHQRVALDSWKAFARPAKKLKAGDTIQFTNLAATVAEKGEMGEVTLCFDRLGDDLWTALETAGAMPLPPYIRQGKAAESDKTDYQTIFARHQGAVAAPTAGLHFTEALLARLMDAGIGHATVTLHVGAGTFLPVKVDDTKDHKMHAEHGIITPATAQAINQTRLAGGRVVAVGTTSLRLLESAATEDGLIQPFDAATDIFITPGYGFRAVDLLMTNFHLPRSTLFMLVSAFAGLDRMHAAYDHAKSHGYRFYSYGDACLLERRAP
jgi:S-adenosylmethionine:tRNA ribosyltransferase-isomerase